MSQPLVLGFDLKNAALAVEKGENSPLVVRLQEKLDRVEVLKLVADLDEKVLQAALRGKTSVVVYSIEDERDWIDPPSKYEGSYTPDRLAGVAMSLHQLLTVQGYTPANGFQILVADVEDVMGWHISRCIQLSWE